MNDELYELCMTTLVGKSQLSTKFGFFLVSHSILSYNYTCKNIEICNIQQNLNGPTFLSSMYIAIDF